MSIAPLPLVEPPRPLVPATAERSSAPSTWAKLLLATASRATLFTIIGMMFWAAAPAILGWTPTTVVSDSMAPLIRAGDVVVTLPMEVARLRPGQILLVEDPDHDGRLRLHRFVDVTDEGQLITKGDANPAADSTPVDPADVRGVGLVRIPFVGAPVVWLHERNVALLMATGLGLALLMIVSNIDTSLRRRHAQEEKSPRQLTGRLARLRARLLAAVPAIVGLGLAACVVVSGGAGAAFSASTGAPGNTFASSTFPCLERSPSYSPYFYFAYNEASGASAADSSGNARAGTLVTGATRSTGTCATNASPVLTLNGTTGEVSTPNLVAGPQAFTVETWFRTTTTTGGKLIGFSNVQSGLSSQYDRHLYMTNAGKLVFGVYNSAYLTLASANSYNDGALHHVAATMSSSGAVLYVDGVSVASSSSIRAAEAHTGYWRIGFDNISGWPSAPTSNYFKGTLDDTAVFTTVLTAAQVAAEFAKGT